MTSPKLGLVLGPWAKTELYLNAGTGFHSNDARGTVTTVDPATLAPVSPSPFLVRSKGAEVGVRTQPVKDTTSTFAVFLLDFNSEILFVGDAGTTEASRPSRRIGAEYTLRSKLTPWLWLDLDAAYTRARFLEDDPAAPGRYIPGATEGVVSAALNFDNVWGGWFGGVRWRYFGPRPLIEDNSVRSKQSAPVSARLGYKFADGLIVRVDGASTCSTNSRTRSTTTTPHGWRPSRARSTTSISIRSSRAPSACRCARSFDGVDAPSQSNVSPAQAGTHASTRVALTVP